MTRGADEADAVVIGAGVNGLVAANILADAGWNVLVLEATSRIGGAVQTSELTEPGFRHDVCSAFYPLGVSSPILAGLDLTEHGLRWRHAPAVLAHVFPDDRCAVIHHSVERTMQSVSAFASRDGARWHAQLAAWNRIRDRLLETLFTPFPPVRSGTRLLADLGLADALRFARMATMSPRTLANETFAGDGAKLLFAGNALHSDLGPENAGGAVFGWLLSMLAQDVGFPVPEGGADRISTALAHRLRSRGGRISCSREVTGVLIARGQAVGVEDVSGTRVRARHAVLADVPAPTLYLRLVGSDQLPRRLVTDLHRFHWDPATVKVDWALSGPIPWRNPEAGSAGTVHLPGDLSALTRYSTDLAGGRIPTDPMLILGQMTTADPTRSPSGTEVGWAYTRVPQASLRDNDAVQRFTDHMEQTVERHAPGFRDRIRGRHVFGPGDLEQHDPALVNGAINGGTAAMHQQLLFRPVPGVGRADTPIDRLYLAGASAHPGGAVHGGPGSNAARAALTRSGMVGTWYARMMGILHSALYADSPGGELPDHPGEDPRGRNGATYR